MKSCHYSKIYDHNSRMERCPKSIEQPSNHFLVILHLLTKMKVAMLLLITCELVVVNQVAQIRTILSYE
jgi:hypothetical protein